MRRRRARSGGQAIVMVTLSLISMSGMMGLAIDLGWSYFDQKAAQAAVDTAALSAVQRAYKSILATGSSATAFTSCGTNGVTCEVTPVACDAGNPGLGNLQSGCLYAKNAGFTPGGHGGRQNLLVEANVPPTFPDSIPATPGSPRDLVYWVTVRAYENIPQLFSAVLGNKSGAISAVATAALASKIVPGSFYGMDHQGDCFSAGGGSYCGVDFVGKGGSGTCASGPSAFLCAPGGAFIASTCHGVAASGCSGNGNYAGSGSLNGGPMIDIQVASALDPGGTYTPSPTVTPSGGSQDPTQGEKQPPLATSNAIPSCGLKGGTLSSAQPVGPFQYYSYTTTNSSGPIPTGAPISTKGNITFAANGSCPGVLSSGGALQSSSAFPMYVFYGGFSTGDTVTFGSGQYVMAGVTGSGNTVFSADKAELDTAGAGASYSGTGNLFIFTNQNYPGLSAQLSTVPNNTIAIPAMQYGSIYLKGGAGNTGSDLFGLADNSDSGTTNLPSALNAYGGLLFWQDRGNSTVTYDANGNVTSQTNPNCPAATCQSPQFLLDHGHDDLVGLHGVLYQPRGAWFMLENGGANLSNSPLQLMTGALIGSSGNDHVQLTAPSVPLIRYLPALIQ